MSADNWRQCPRCVLDSEAQRTVERTALAKEYGTMPPEEFIKQSEELKARHSRPLVEETLREDYEFYIDEEHVFSVDYSCHCEACGFAHAFNHKETLELAT